MAAFACPTPLQSVAPFLAVSDHTSAASALVPSPRPRCFPMRFTIPIASALCYWTSAPSRPRCQHLYPPHPWHLDCDRKGDRPPLQCDSRPQLSAGPGAAWPRVLFNRDSRNNQGSEPYGPTLLTRAALSSSAWIVSRHVPLCIQLPRRHGRGRPHLRERCEVLQGFRTRHGGLRSLRLEVLVKKLLVRLMLVKILGCEHEGDDRDVGVQLDLHQGVNDRGGNKLMAIESPPAARAAARRT